MLYIFLESVWMFSRGMELLKRAGSSRLLAGCTKWNLRFSTLKHRISITNKLGCSSISPNIGTTPDICTRRRRGWWWWWWCASPSRIEEREILLFRDVGNALSIFSCRHRSRFNAVPGVHNLVSKVPNPLKTYN